MQTQPDPPGPFQIIHNYRPGPGRRDRPKRKISACERLQHFPEFTMRTRKMTAEIELRQEALSQPSANNEESLSNHADPLKPQGTEEFLMRNEEDLENGIPFMAEQKELFFNLEENSHASNYSKLERALFGFNFHEEMEEE